MPFYEYSCKQCQKRFEIKLSMEEKTNGNDIFCPECHSDQVKQEYQPLGYVKQRGDVRPGCCGESCARCPH